MTTMVLTSNIGGAASARCAHSGGATDNTTLKTDV